jgi:hypothetical protein
LRQKELALGLRSKVGGKKEKGEEGIKSLRFEV